MSDTADEDSSSDAGADATTCRQMCIGQIIAIVHHRAVMCCAGGCSELLVSGLLRQEHNEKRPLVCLCLTFPLNQASAAGASSSDVSEADADAAAQDEPDK